MVDKQYELYKGINSLQVAGHSYDEIQGMPAKPFQSPFRGDHIAEFSTVSVNGEMKENPHLISGRLIQISPLHGRSYEMRFGTTRGVIWEDEFGNLFSALNTKGNNLETPKALKHPAAPSGYIVYGMQDSDAMVRVLRGSLILRKNNIDTETIVRVVEPQELPIEDKLVSLDEFKAKLVNKIWNENAKKDSEDSITGRPQLARTEVTDLSLALDKMTFYLTVRGLQVSERMWDLPYAQSEEEFKEMMAGVFKFVNLSERTQHKKSGSELGVLQFDASKEEDIQHYFLEYLPVKIATNLAKIHNLGLVHHFPHAGNISAAGGFYDLDSLRGEALGLGDPKIENEEYEGELSYLLNGSSSDQGVLSVLENLVEYGYLKKEMSYLRKFRNLFMHQYIKTRGWEEDILANFEMIAKLFGGFSDGADTGILKYYAAHMTQATGIDYHHKDYMNLLKQALPASEGEYREWQIRQTIRQLNEAPIDENDVEPKADSEGKGSANKLFDLVEQDFQVSNQAELEKITEKYGKRIAELVTHVFVNKEIRNAALTVSTESMERIITSDIKKEAVRRIGWEDNILEHIDDIWELFDHFGFIVDDSMQAYYTELLAAQLGWDYRFAEDFSVTTAAYLDHARSTLINFFKDQVNDNPSGSDREVINQAYKETYTDEPAFTTDDFWTAFIRERMNADFSIVRDKEFDQLLEQYGEDTLSTVVAMFIGREENRINGEILNEEMRNQIAKLEKEMELDALEKYSMNPELLSVF